MSPTTNNSPAGSERFRTTRWTVIRTAARAPSTEAEAALEELCTAYWYPLYAFVRRQGHGVDDARDLTQGFFASFIAGDYLEGLDPERGRFRSYLLGALRHFMANERERGRAQKRGGDRRAIALELDEAERRYAVEPVDEASPERLFERRWALTLLERTLERLRAEQERRGRGPVFERLARFLDGGEGPGGCAAAVLPALPRSRRPARIAFVCSVVSARRTVIGSRPRLKSWLRESVLCHHQWTRRQTSCNESSAARHPARRCQPNG